VLILFKKASQGISAPAYYKDRLMQLFI